MFELERIGKLRKQLGLTQKQLADLSGVSQSLIAKIEAGKIDPAYSKVVQIINALEAVQKKEKKTALEVMTSNVISADPDETIDKIANIMREKNISQIPVIRQGKCIGSISEGAIIDLVSKHTDPKSTKVREIMQESFPVVPANSLVDMVVDLLKHYPAVLVDQNGKLVGIITKADLLKAI